MSVPVRRFEQAAVDLAAIGYHQFPCRTRAKVPLTRHGWKDATRDEQQILRWWDRWPDANIAIACGPSGIDVLDIDSKHGANPAEVLSRLGLDTGHTVVWTGTAGPPDAEYPDSLEGVRGCQVYFRGELPTGKTSVKGVELRGVGGYVVAPPSVHPRGDVYAGDLPPVASLPELSAAVLAILEPETPDSGTTTQRPEDDEQIEQGGRHEALLAWGLSRLTSYGVLDAVALDAMHGHNQRFCRPPLEDDEVKRLWKWLNKTKIAKKERRLAEEPASFLNPRGKPREPDPDDNGTAPTNGDRPHHHGLFTTRKADLSLMRPTRFLWRPYLIESRLNLLVGEEGSGKSTVEMWIAAQATRGELNGQPVRVLFVGADEDSWNEVVLPRLYALDADLDLVEEFVATDGTTIFDVDKHAGELARVLLDGEFGLVVFEQLMDVLPPMRNNTDAIEVRRAVRPLRQVLAVCETTGIGTLHVNKGAAEKLRQIQQGSIQLGALSRSSVLIAKHPTDDGRRVLVLGKRNYIAEEESAAFSFRVVNHHFEHNGHVFDVGRVEDVQDEDMTVEQALATPKTDSESPVDEHYGDVLELLGEEPVSERALAGQLDVVSRSTVHRILERLRDDKLAEATTRGWKLVLVQPPIGTENQNQFAIDDEGVTS